MSPRKFRSVVLPQEEEQRRAERERYEREVIEEQRRIAELAAQRAAQEERDWAEQERLWREQQAEQEARRRKEEEDRRASIDELLAKLHRKKPGLKGDVADQFEVAAGMVAETMKKIEATSSPQPAKKPHLAPKTCPTHA